MKRVQILVIALAFAVLSAKAQTIEKRSDRKAVKAVAAAWQDAWNRHDMDALASLMAQDVDFVTVLGVRGWLKDRKQFKERHVEIHQTLFKESVWSTKETRIKFIRPNLAIVHLLWETKGDIIPDRTPGEPRGGIFTWVLEKRRGKWLIIAAQNTENRESSISKPSGA